MNCAIVSKSALACALRFISLLRGVRRSVLYALRGLCYTCRYVMWCVGAILMCKRARRGILLRALREIKTKRESNHV